MGEEVDYACGPTNHGGPEYYIRCTDDEACGKNVFHVLKAWIAHCKKHGCACDLLHIIGRADRAWRGGFVMRDVLTDEAVGVRRERVAGCTSGSFGAEWAAERHQKKCGCACLGQWNGSQAEEARMVGAPKWFMQCVRKGM